MGLTNPWFCKDNAFLGASVCSCNPICATSSHHDDANEPRSSPSNVCFVAFPCCEERRTRITKLRCCRPIRARALAPCPSLLVFRRYRPSSSAARCRTRVNARVSLSRAVTFASVHDENEKLDASPTHQRDETPRMGDVSECVRMSPVDLFHLGSL